MKEAGLFVKRYGTGRAVFNAQCDAKYAEAAWQALSRSTRLTPFVDDAFLASELRARGVPPEVLAHLMSTLRIEDEVFLTDQPGRP